MTIPAGSLLGSPARFLAGSRTRFSYVMPCDDDHNPLPEPGVRYHPRAALIPRQLTHEEWLARYGQAMAAED